MRKIIHVDMDCFYAQVEMRDRPELTNVPLAIGGAPGTRSVLCTSNYIARKFGVIIQVEGNITNDHQFTATFTNESLEDILELLRLSTSIDYSISKQEKLPNETFSQRIVTLICK